MFLPVISNSLVLKLNGGGAMSDKQMHNSTEVWAVSFRAELKLLDQCELTELMI